MKTKFLASLLLSILSTLAMASVSEVQFKTQATEAGQVISVHFKKEDGTWTVAKNMGDTINTKTTDYAASLSPDGKYFFYTSNSKGSSDIYWVSSKIIENLRKKD